MVVGGRRGFVQQAIDPRIAEVAAVESDGRNLLGVEHPAKNVRIDHRATGPLKREHLKVAFEHVCVQRRELVRAHVERDADVAEVLLDDGGLQPVELDIRDLQRETQPWLRSVAVGIAIPRFIEQRDRLRWIVIEGCNVGFKGPRDGREDADGRFRQAPAQVLDDGLAIDGVADGLPHAKIFQNRIPQVQTDVLIVDAR